MLSDDEFRRLLDHLDRPWSGFRKVRKGVKKRVRRHMAMLDTPTIDLYLTRIDQDPHHRAICERHLSVSISRFFRDRRLWEELQVRFLPALAHRATDRLKAWSAGCARGEEPLSLAMVWEETAATLTAPPALNILATDAEPSYLQQARDGLYPPGSLKEVPRIYKERWFENVRGGRQLRVDAGLQARIDWQVHQLLEDPPGDAFDLILLRNNLLTYYQGVRLQTAFARIVDRISPGGMLVVGSHERLPTGKVDMMRDAACPWVYVRFAG